MAVWNSPCPQARRAAPRCRRPARISPTTNVRCRAAGRSLILDRRPGHGRGTIGREQLLRHDQHAPRRRRMHPAEERPQRHRREGRGIAVP